MKSRISQQGSTAHIVIVVVLVVALLGALGFIFWQNFIKQEDTSQVQTPQSSETVQDEPTEDGETVSQTLDGYTLTYTHPADWKKTSEGLISPDSEVNLELVLSNPQGLGGTCGGDDAVTDPLVQTSWEAVPQYSGAIFSSYVYKDTTSGANYYSMGLQPSGREEIKRAQPGDSACLVYSSIPGFIFLNSDMSTVLRGQVSFTSLRIDAYRSRSDLSLQEIESAFDSEYAKQAKQILLSVQVKKQ